MIQTKVLIQHPPNPQHFLGNLLKMTKIIQLITAITLVRTIAFTMPENGVWRHWFGECYIIDII